MTFNEDVLRALADPDCRKIIFSVKDKPHTIKELIEKTSIPQGTIFTKISTLEKLDLIQMAQYSNFKNAGPKARIFSSNFVSANIEISGIEPKIKIFKKIREDLKSAV